MSKVKCGVDGCEDEAVVLTWPKEKPRCRDCLEWDMEVGKI